MGDVFYNFNGETMDIWYGSGGARETEYAPYYAPYGLVYLHGTAINREGEMVQVYTDYAFNTEVILKHIHSSSKTESARKLFEIAKYMLKDKFVDIDKFGRETLNFDKIENVIGSWYLHTEGLSDDVWIELKHQFLENAEALNVDISRFDFSNVEKLNL